MLLSFTPLSGIEDATQKELKGNKELSLTRYRGFPPDATQKELKVVTIACGCPCEYLPGCNSERIEGALIEGGLSFNSTDDATQEELKVCSSRYSL